jgi:hypothetical protein
MANARFGRPCSYERGFPSRGLCGLRRKVLGKLCDELVKRDPAPGGLRGKASMNVSWKLDCDWHGSQCRRRVDPLTDDFNTFAPSDPRTAPLRIPLWL